MEEEMKKKVLIGNTGNRAEITREEKDTKSERAQHAKELVRQSGKLFCPDGAEYCGFGVVHFWKTKGIATDNFGYTAQTDTSATPEICADLGWKGLGEDLQRSYGRTPPRTRN